MGRPDSAVDCVVWGLGTGRHLGAPLADQRRVLVLAIDVDPAEAVDVRERLAAYPEAVDALDDGRLEVVVGPPAVLAGRYQELGSDPGPAPELRVYLPALVDVPPAAEPLARAIARVHEEQRASHRVQQTMRDNLRRNLATVASTPGLAAIRDRARGMPGFVVAAGPSARSAVGLLRRAAAVGPIIAVDTIWPLLQTVKIPVDCLATVDPHRASLDHFRTGIEEVGLLAFQPYAVPEIVASRSRRVVALPRGDRLFDACAADLGLARVDVASTVLLFALQIAACLGCDPIVVVGADLAHPGGLTHARGTARARAAADIGVTTPDWRGEPVPTTSMMLGFLAAIEHHLATVPRRHLWLDGGGARVRGATRVDAEHLLHMPVPGAYERRPLLADDAGPNAAELDRRLAVLHDHVDRAEAEAQGGKQADGLNVSTQS